MGENCLEKSAAKSCLKRARNGSRLLQLGSAPVVRSALVISLALEIGSRRQLS